MSEVGHQNPESRVLVPPVSPAGPLTRPDPAGSKVEPTVPSSGAGICLPLTEDASYMSGTLTVCTDVSPSFPEGGRALRAQNVLFLLVAQDSAHGS